MGIKGVNKLEKPVEFSLKRIPWSYASYRPFPPGDPVLLLSPSKRPYHQIHHNSVLAGSSARETQKSLTHFSRQLKQFSLKSVPQSLDSRFCSGCLLLMIPPYNDCSFYVSQGIHIMIVHSMSTRLGLSTLVSCLSPIFRLSPFISSSNEQFTSLFNACHKKS